MNFDKVKAIRKWPTLISTKKNLFFLGFAGFYQKFIKGYLKIIVFSTKITKKDIVFIWRSKNRKPLTHSRNNSQQTQF